MNFLCILIGIVSLRYLHTPMRCSMTEIALDAANRIPHFMMTLNVGGFLLSSMSIKNATETH